MRAAAFVALFLALVVTGGSRPPLAQAGQKGTEVKIGSLKAVTPADWESEKPANLLRSYQFKLPGAEDFPRPQLVIFPQSNPDPEKNFPRWKAQIIPPEGKTIDDVSKTGKWDVPGATVTYLDMTGTWKYKDAPQDPKSKEMLLDD